MEIAKINGRYMIYGAHCAPYIDLLTLRAEIEREKRIIKLQFEK